MFKLDDNLLHELGLGALPVAEKNQMLALIYDRLELNVGMRLAEQMSDAQLEEFEKLMPNEGDSKDTALEKEKQAFHWLETNFPHYKDVVAEELEKLKAEIKATAPQIVAAAQEAVHAQQPVSQSQGYPNQHQQQYPQQQPANPYQDNSYQQQALPPDDHLGNAA